MCTRRHIQEHSRNTIQNSKNPKQFNNPLAEEWKLNCDVLLNVILFLNEQKPKLHPSTWMNLKNNAEF